MAPGATGVAGSWRWVPRVWQVRGAGCHGCVILCHTCGTQRHGPATHVAPVSATLAMMQLNPPSEPFRMPSKTTHGAIATRVCHAWHWMPRVRHTCGNGCHAQCCRLRRVPIGRHGTVTAVTSGVTDLSQPLHSRKLLWEWAPHTHDNGWHGCDGPVTTDVTGVTGPRHRM